MTDAPGLDSTASGIPYAKVFPAIAPVAWLSAKEVLGGEASAFTPWLHLQPNMDVLGRALGLDELTSGSTEFNVLGKRLDILATALDENGDEIPICIENQYGMTDATHLGRMIAYLAHKGRGRAVWIVERSHDAFTAAVRFLNRTSTDEVGYYLVQVRFTHGQAGGYQVHYEILAAPIEGEGGGRGAPASRLNTDKITYLGQIHERVRDRLLAAGFPNMNTHARGSYLWLKWPPGFWLAPFSQHMTIRATRDNAIVGLPLTGFGSKAANTAAGQVLREELGAQLEDIASPESEVDWDAVGSGSRKIIKFVLAGGGYGSGSADEVADWAATTSAALLAALHTPIPQVLAVASDPTTVSELDEEHDES